MAVLTHAEIKACIHPRQRARFILALLCAVILLPLMALIAAFGIVSMLLFWFLLLVWVGGRIFFANFVGNSILVSDLNYPRIQHLTEELKASLGVDKKVDVFIYEHGSFNAYMVKLFFRRAIFLNSEILETGVSDDEVRWIVGRFVGYWRAQKNAGIAGWLIRAAQRFIILNFFILPYDRAMVYTGDRLALATIGGDISTGISAMQKLLVGRQLGYSVNPIGVVEQSRRVKGSFFAFLARLTSGFPHTVTRYVDMIVFAKRVYPEQFRLFNAANPGLPPDIERLSAEVGSPGAMFRAIAVLFGIFLAVAAFGLALTGVVQRTGMFGLGNVFDRPDLGPPPPSETDPDSAAPPDGAGTTDQGQPAAEPPPAEDQSAPPDKSDTNDQPAPEPPPAQPPRKQRSAIEPSVREAAIVRPEPPAEAGGASLPKQVSIRDADGTVYTGTAVGRVPEGTGRMQRANGDTFGGSFHNGDYVAGVYTWADGDRYEGTFANSTPDGTGTYLWADGTRFSGTFTAGQPNGHGTFTYPDGRTYNGDVRNGLPEGAGAMTRADGSVTTGQWVEGRPSATR